MTSRALTVLLAALLLCLPGLAHAKEPGSDAAALRRELPEPTPAVSLAFQGDLIEQGIWVGEVEYSLKAAVVATQATWRATEMRYYDGQTGEVREQRRLAFDRDLTLASGTVEVKTKKSTTSIAISRVPGGYSLLRTVRTADASGEPVQQKLDTDVPVLHGQMALLLLLRAVPAKSKTWIDVPWLEIGSEVSVQTLRVRARGEGRAGQGDLARDTFIVDVERAGQVFGYHLDRKTRDLVAVEAPDGHSHVAPAGVGRARVDVDERAPARTWEQAFLKFGYGYHMAREELIDESFDWDAMYAHETEVLKRWPKDQDIEAFKTAWIGEFVANSLHRSRGDAGRLLAMTLSSGKVTEESDRRVVFEAHPTFGGGVKRTYVFEKTDDIWRLVRIDF